MPYREISLVELLHKLSTGLDFTVEGVDAHHRRVTTIALHLGHAVRLDNQQLEELYKASILHDIGVITLKEKFGLHTFDVEDTWAHCYKGAQLVRGIENFDSVSEIILSHHDLWKGDNISGLCKNSIPLLSRIILLADRLDILIKPDTYILEQRDPIIQKILALAGTVFDPDLIALLSDLSKNDSFWFDITSPWIESCLMNMVPEGLRNTKINNLNNVGQLFARAVDARSPFTYRHSHYVSVVCGVLARKIGLSDQEMQQLEVAGFLHDIGKLAIPEEIIEKPGRLTPKEFEIVKKHPYYTYWLFNSISPETPVCKWAAYHHERLDGKGYPFRISGSEMDIQSRIVAVADVFTALREDRPYRDGLHWSQISSIMNEFVSNSGLDGEIVSLLYSAKEDLDTYWAKTTRVLKDVYFPCEGQPKSESGCIGGSLKNDYYRFLFNQS